MSWLRYSIDQIGIDGHRLGSMIIRLGVSSAAAIGNHGVMLPIPSVLVGTHELAPSTVETLTWTQRLRLDYE